MSFEALDWAWRQPLKQGPKLVLLALADYANDDGVCWPGFDALVEKTSMSRSAVIEAIKALTEAGLVAVEKRADANGYRASNRYHLNTANVRNPDLGHAKVQDSDSGESKVRNPNVRNPDSGTAGGNAISANPQQATVSAKVRNLDVGRTKVRKTNVGNPDLGASKVRNPDAKVRNPDPNLQLEPSARDTSSPNGDSVSACAALDLSVLPADLSPAVWADWCRHRKAKKAPVNTQTVVNAIARELEEARGYGWLPDAALAEAMAAGWQGVKADWLANRGKQKESPMRAPTTASGLSTPPRKAASTRTVSNEDFHSKRYVGTPIDDIDWMR